MSLIQFFSFSPLTRLLLAKFREIRHQYLLKRIHIRMPGVVFRLQILLEKGGFFFFFDMGTLLGIIREGKLLSHDGDIDIGVKLRNLTDVSQIQDFLLANGCKLQKSCHAPGIGIFAQSYILDGVKFDIGYYYEKASVDYCYLIVPKDVKCYENSERAVVCLHCPRIQEVVKKPFLGQVVNCPQNAEEYLAIRYGQNWKIPDKNYKYWLGPSTHECDIHAFVELNH